MTSYKTGCVSCYREESFLSLNCLCLISRQLDVCLFSEAPDQLKVLVRDSVNNSCPSITSYILFGRPVARERQGEVRWGRSLFLPSGFT